MRSKVRVGVIGLGKMGLLHASILNVLPDVELAALCDKSALMARLCRRVFFRSGIEVVSDFEKLSEFGLDAVYVTTPISSHSYIVKNVCTKGIARNIFVEKTLAASSDQAKELCGLVKNTASITMVGYMKRFCVTFRKAEELLAQGILGELTSFKAHAYSSDFLGLTKDSRSSASRGGALQDLGCHVLDLALWLFNDLEFDDVISQDSQIGFETSVVFTAKSERLKGIFDISQRMENYRMPELGLFVNGSKGTMEINDDRLRLNLTNGAFSEWFRHDLNDSVGFWLGEAEYFREDQMFIESVLKNRKCEPDFDTASRVDYIIDQVRNRSNRK